MAREERIPVGREALVQPHAAKIGRCDQVAEPHVGRLVRHHVFVGARSGDQRGADRHAGLVLHGAGQTGRLAVAVLVEGVGLAGVGGQEVQDLTDVREVVERARRVLGEDLVVQGDRGAVDLDRIAQGGVGADRHRDQVGRDRVVLFPDPGPLSGARRRDSDQSAVGVDMVVFVGSNRDACPRLVARQIPAGEPVAGVVGGIVGVDHMLAVEAAEVEAGARFTRVGDVDAQGVAGGERLWEQDPQRIAEGGVFRGCSVDPESVDLQVGQVQSDLVEGGCGAAHADSRRADDPPGVGIGLQKELVAQHVEAVLDLERPGRGQSRCRRAARLPQSRVSVAGQMTEPLAHQRRCRERGTQQHQKRARRWVAMLHLHATIVASDRPMTQS